MKWDWSYKMGVDASKFSLCGVPLKKKGSPNAFYTTGNVGHLIMSIEGLGTLDHFSLYQTCWTCTCCGCCKTYLDHVAGVTDKAAIHLFSPVALQSPGSYPDISQLHLSAAASSFMIFWIRDILIDVSETTTSDDDSHLFFTKHLELVFQIICFSKLNIVVIICQFES